MGTWDVEGCKISSEKTCHEHQTVDETVVNVETAGDGETHGSCEVEMEA